MFRLVDLLNIFSLSFDEQKALKELSWKFQPLSDFSFIWNPSGGFNWSDLFEECYRFTHSLEQKGFVPSSSDLSNFKKARYLRPILIDKSYSSNFVSHWRTGTLEIAYSAALFSYLFGREMSKEWLQQYLQYSTIVQKVIEFHQYELRFYPKMLLSKHSAALIRAFRGKLSCL